MPLFYNWSSIKSGYNNYTNSIVTSDLMIYVDASKSSSYPGSGNIFYDLSGNSKNMTISNCTYDGSKSFSFNGSTSYIVSPDIYTLFTSSNSTFNQTHEIWFKSSSANGVIIDEQGYGFPSSGWHDSQLEIVSNTIKARVWNQSPPYSTVGTNDTTKWMYVAFRYNGSANTIDGYFNGSPFSLTSVTRFFSPNPAGYHISLGYPDATNMGAGSAFSGNIAIYRTYKRPLTNTEILQNYNSEKSSFGY